MKLKNNSAMLVLSSVVCLLPIILSFVIYGDLPEQIAIQWSSSGQANNFVHKSVAAFGLPFIFFIINIYSKLRLYNDPKRSHNNHSRAVQMIASWLPPLLSLILVPLTLFISMGVNIPISIIIPVSVGVLFILCGNYLPKCRQNYTIGIKLPWTLHDADNWNKTHRMAGYLWIFGGIILIAGTFIFPDSASMGFSLSALLVIPLIMVPVIYSYLLYRKSGKDVNGTDE